MFYLLHGTSIENLIKILNNENPFLKVKPDNTNFDTKLINFKGIFTHLLYPGIPHSNKQDPCWTHVCLILDSRILKDLPFFATRLGGFDDISFKVLAHGRGKLKKIPSLSKLKKFINERITTFSTSKKSRNDLYKHSHEVVISEDVPLKKYLLKIIIYGYVSKNDRESLNNFIAPIIYKPIKEKNIDSLTNILNTC